MNIHNHHVNGIVVDGVLGTGQNINLTEQNQH